MNLTDIIKDLQLKVASLETHKSVALDEVSEVKQDVLKLTETLKKIQEDYETMFKVIEDTKKQVGELNVDFSEVISEAVDDVETYLKGILAKNPKLFHNRREMIKHMEDYIKRTNKGLNWYTVYQTLQFKAKGL